MISVIKTKYGDNVREKKENKRRIVSLMAVVYKIHAIVRGEGENRFLLLLFLFTKLREKRCLQQRNMIRFGFCNEFQLGAVR